MLYCLSRLLKDPISHYYGMFIAYISYTCEKFCLTAEYNSINSMLKYEMYNKPLNESSIS